MTLDGVGILITGGGRGLGAALAEALAKVGARVCIVARSEEELFGVQARMKGQVSIVPGDVSDKYSIYKIAGAAAACIGNIDIVIHNASTLGPVPLRLLVDTACEDFERALAVNVLGPFRLTKAVLGGMLARGRGLIVHISSDAAVEACPRWGAYGSSKAALDQMGRIWEAELRDTGVGFLRIDPGEMNTRMHAEAVPAADPDTLADPRDVAARIVPSIQEALR